MNGRSTLIVFAACAGLGLAACAPSQDGGGAASGGAPGAGGADSGTGGSTGAGTGGVAAPGTGGAPLGAGTGGRGVGGAGAGGTGAGGRVAGSGGRGGTGGGAGTGGAGTGGAGASGTGGSGAGGAVTTAGALIHNDVFWKDTAGNPIYSQGGGVFKFGATYYWYGVKYNGAVSYVANTRKNSDTSFNAVTCYSSTDLVSWKNEGNILSAASSGPEVAGASWLGRLGVAYNATTKKYVLVSQYQGTAGDGELFATSDSPTGAFTFDHVQAVVTNVANMTTGDQTLFVDDDGSAYVICSSSMGRSNLYVAPLRKADYLNVEPATRIFGGAGREGNAMFKYAGHYYFCSSDLHGWNASHTYCISATNIMGPYGAESVMTNTDNDFSHVTQTGFFITVNGSAQSMVIFAGDRWADFAGNGIGFNQWCPLTFNGTAPVFQSWSEWSLDAATGAFAAGPGNNYALNPSFEADRVAMTQPAGWTATTNLSGATPHTNASGGHTGNWTWRITYAGAYQATLEQVATGLPSGTYTLSAWAKSSGGQSVAQLYATGSGAEKTADLNTAISSWTQKSVTGIAVSGQCRIGVAVTGGSGQTLDVDDFTLIRTGP